LLDSSYVLSYLKDIEDIKKWGIEVKTQLLENYIDFGNYCLLLSNIIWAPQKKGIGQGLI
jgi:hypothetical protein